MSAPVRPRILDYLERQDRPRQVAEIAHGAQVSRKSVHTVLRELEAAGRLDTDRTRPGFWTYQLRPGEEG